MTHTYISNPNLDSPSDSFWLSFSFSSNVKGEDCHSMIRASDSFDEVLLSLIWGIIRSVFLFNIDSF